MQPRQLLPTTDLFCRLAPLLLLVTPFSSCILTASLQQPPPQWWIHDGSFQRCRLVPEPAPREIAACFPQLLSVAAFCKGSGARPTSVEQHRPAEWWWARAAASTPASYNNPQLRLVGLMLLYVTNPLRCLVVFWQQVKGTDRGCYLAVVVGIQTVRSNLYVMIPTGILPKVSSF